MTSASSLAVPAMEVPALDDTMEMASPYQGHADDFDIDIDVMEDQASNADKDMTGADDFEGTGADYNQDGANDADMIDETAENAEPAMVDADDQGQEADYNVEMEDGAEKDYEAEMLEYDFDEDIDLPVSGDAQEQPQPAAHADGQDLEGSAPIQTGLPAEETGEQPTVETTYQAEPEHTEQSNQQNLEEIKESVENPQMHESSNGEEHGADQLQVEDTQETAGDTNETQYQAPQEPLEDEFAKGPAGDEHPQNENENAGTAFDPQTVEEHQKPEVVQEEKQADATESNAPNEYDAGQEEGGQVDAAEFQASNEDEQEQAVEQQSNELESTSSLYPVKVYYQDNEISLFPPREGDSSETFFLADESVAFEPFGKLFESCRAILGEHVGENEVLVVDVDVLNIQLTEDCMYTPKVTLYQIIDLYLRLCHNDGIEEPEALYITLSTKQAITAELSDLAFAASEGKGLSGIHSWEEYPEAEVAEEFAEEEEQAHVSGDNNLEDQHESHPSDKHEDPEAEVDAHQQDNASTGHEQKEADDDDHDEPAEELAHAAPDKEAQGDGNDANAQTVSTLGAEDVEHFDFEHNNEPPHPEEQKTESTTTVAPLAESEVQDGQQDTEEPKPTGSVHEDQPGDEAHNYFHEGEDTGEAEYHQQETDPINDQSHDTEHHEEYGHDETFEDDATGTAFVETGEEANHEGTQFEEDLGDTASQDNEDFSEETVQGDEADAENQPSETVHDEDLSHVEKDDTQPASQDGEKPVETAAPENPTEEPSGEPTEVPTEEPIEVPTEEATEETAAVGNNEHLEAQEDGEILSSKAANDEGDELNFDDDDYLDLGFPDDFGGYEDEPEAPSPSLGASKRTREADDDSGVAETTSPDPKRRRPS